jgi:hypothetical protein
MTFATERKTILMFPDYMSSGLWKDHVNVEPSSLGVSPELQLALKYWHEVWEFVIAYNDNDNRKWTVSKSYIERWMQDGNKLAKMLTKQSKKYKFVYKD